MYDSKRLFVRFHSDFNVHRMCGSSTKLVGKMKRKQKQPNQIRSDAVRVKVKLKRFRKSEPTISFPVETSFYTLSRCHETTIPTRRSRNRSGRKYIQLPSKYFSNASIRVAQVEQGSKILFGDHHLQKFP